MNKAFAILLIAVIVVGIISLTLGRKGKPQMQDETQDNDFPPKPKWKPALPIDIERTVKTFAYYCDNKKSFVVFKNGTCVIVSENSPQPGKEAEETLGKIYNFHPDFNTQAMDDRNFLVRYSQPGFSIVFKDEFEKNKDYIEQHHLEGLTRDEVLLDAQGRPNKFDDRGKIGLFGRARMFLDAQNPIVVKTWKPGN